MRQFIKISITTPSYNQGQFLEETILSVLNQNYPNLEYIIIDGGSTDNSVNIIKKYEDQLAYWVSEKDQGQTHAINKGFKIATGDIVNWLNSDDLLVPGALQAVAEGFIEYPQADFYFGDFTVINNKGRELFSRKSPPYRFATLFWGRQLSSQPAVFFKRSVFDEIGYLDESLNFCMDTEFWIRAAIAKNIFHQIKKPLAMTRVHGDAKTTQLQKVLHEEHKSIVKRYHQWKFADGSISEDMYYTILNRLWRFVASLNRFIYRGDWTFGMANRALKSVRKENGSGL